MFLTRHGTFHLMPPIDCFAYCLHFVQIVFFSTGAWSGERGKEQGQAPITNNDTPSKRKDVTEVKLRAEMGAKIVDEQCE